MGNEELAILKYALAREREGAKFYRERAREIHVPEVRELFAELAEMEMDHVSFIVKKQVWFDDAEESFRASNEEPK